MSGDTAPPASQEPNEKLALLIIKLKYRNKSDNLENSQWNSGIGQLPLEASFGLSLESKMERLHCGAVM